MLYISKKDAYTESCTGTEKVVVLTPYLGQLHLLQTVLCQENDPILNDLDSFDLVRAGLLPAASAKLTHRKIHLSTIGKQILYHPLYL